jgi:phosphohistidine phosphatase
MKRLTLLRHAKSSWDTPGLQDFDRPLNTRGREAARLVGRELNRRKMRFDLVLASPARRVRETLEELADGFGSAFDIRFESRIYLADPDTLLDLVRGLSEDIESPLLVGHNPGLHELALQLLADDAQDFRKRIAEKYPTGALAEIELPAKDWSAAGEQPGTISALVLPRDLSD